MKTDVLTFRLDEETRYLLVACGIIQANTGRKVRSAGDLSDFLRKCIKNTLYSNGTRKLTPIEIQHRYWNLMRLEIQERNAKFEAEAARSLEMAAEKERIYRAMKDREIGNLNEHLPDIPMDQKVELR